MKNYTYTAVDLNGKKFKGVECAGDCHELIEKLREKSLFCTEYKEVSEGIRSGYRFSTKELCLISRQISSMIGAGLSLVKALEILGERFPGKKGQKAIESVYMEVQKGRSFSEALSVQSGMFPDLFIKMTAAGEFSGTLDKTLSGIADHYEKSSATNNRIKGALTYPLILGALTVGIIIMMFTVVLPPFAELIEPEEINPLSGFMINLSNSLVNYRYIYLAVLTGLIFAAKIAPEAKMFRAAADIIKLRFPLTSGIYTKMYTGRFARSMANLYGAGIQILSCMEASASALDNTYFEKKLREAQEDIKNGASLSEALEKTGLFDRMFTSLIYTGEDSGTLEEILDKAADFYEEETDSAISGLVNLIEPILIIIIGLTTALMLAAVFPLLYGGMSELM